MLYKGKKVEGPNEETIIIPRGNGEDFIFKAKAVLNYDEFEAAVKKPVPPTRMMAGEKTHSPLLTDPKYLAEIKKYNRMRLSWLMIKSLQATEDLVWETVDINTPETWNNYERELIDSGFSHIELSRITRGVMIANSLDQDTIDAARASFLAMQREAAMKLNSPTEEQKTTQSGEPAKGSDSGQITLS